MCLCCNYLGETIKKGMRNCSMGIIAMAVLIFLQAGQVCAQTGCPSVNPGANVTLPCGTACTMLHATAVPAGSTTSYGVSQISYSPFSYSAGTPVLVHTDDTFSQVIHLPFNFCFFGNVFSAVIIGSNGVISFDTTYTGGNCPYAVSDSVPGGNTDPRLYNSIMAPWQDIDPTYRGTTTYQIIGTAPCRMFIVSWDSVPLFGDPNSSVYSRDPNNAPYTPNAYFETQQAVLYETSNVIDINIMRKDTVSKWYGGRAIEGLVNSDATAAFTVPGRNGTPWLVQNDAWRFTPNGTPAIYTISWYQADTLIATGDSVLVCPNAALQTTYTAVATITPCAGGGPIVVADSVVVSLTGTLLAGVDSTHNVKCNGARDGMAWAHSSGGAIPVVFKWTDLSTATVLSANTLVVVGLDTGTYVFSATDNNGCARTDTFYISEPPPLSISQLSQISTGCITHDGSVTVTGVGGTGAYQYLWSNNVTGEVDTALGPGTLSVTVTDANGCTSSQSFTISQTSSVSTNPIVHNDRCAQSNDGSIATNPSGGTPPYFYAWSNNDKDSVALLLGPGNYSCTVTDKFGCSAVVSDSVTAPQPQQILSISANAVKCQGDDNGSIFATGTGGTQPYLFSATPDGVTFTADSDGVMGNLAPGNYNVILADANGCIATATINVPNATPDFFEITVDSTLCFGYSDGALQIVDSSPQNRPYQYSIDSTGQFQYASDFGNLAPGNHTVIAINKNGCKTDTIVFIPQPAAVTASISPDTVVLALGQSQQVAVAYQNTSGNVSFSWTPDFGLSCSDCQSPVVGPYIGQDYSVTVASVNQTATCYGTASLYVTVLPHPPVFIPNSFTPNGDGNNDFFEIYGESIKVVTMRVFNRWGEMVFQTNDQFAGWDGTYKGKVQEPGVFSYDAVITFLDNTQMIKTGSVTLLR